MSNKKDIKLLWFKPSSHLNEDSRDLLAQKSDILNLWMNLLNMKQDSEANNFTAVYDLAGKAIEIAKESF